MRTWIGVGAILLAGVAVLVLAFGDADAKNKAGAVVTTRSGLKYQDLKVGEGPAAAEGDTVVVHYTGWLKDGKKFDSSHDHGDEPLPFRIGAGKVIPGWDEGVVGMRAGGKRKLIVPPDLAYGAEGYPPDIPPDAELTFEVELLQIQ